MINRDEALILLKKYLHHKDNIKKSLELEAILKKLASYLERDIELWGLTGLLHNLDYEYCINNPERRGLLSAQVLDGLLPEKAVNAIKADNYMHTDYIPTTILDKALIASVSTAGLITAIVNASPSKKLAEIDITLIIEKFNDERFAARYNRSRIQLCKDIGFDLSTFLKLNYEALKELGQ